MVSDKITLAHGAGGKLSQELMEEVILPAYGNPLLNEMHEMVQSKEQHIPGVASMGGLVTIDKAREGSCPRRSRQSKWCARGTGPVPTN